MQANVVYSLEQLAAIFIGAGIGYFFAPLYSLHRYTLAQVAMPYAIVGGIVGGTWYVAMLAAQHKWGNAAFRFSIREIILLTVIVALVCGWAVDHAANQNKVWQLEVERMNRLSWDPAT